MKRFLAKIWVPLLLVIMAGMQSFGIDASRAVGLKRLADSLALNNLADTTATADSLSPALDSIVSHDTVTDLVLTAKDTIKVPDSLKETDPLKYKYYIALKDSVTRVQVRDSLMNAGDTLELHLLDSLYIKDSTDVAKEKFDKWYGHHRYIRSAFQ